MTADCVVQKYIGLYSAKLYGDEVDTTYWALLAYKVCQENRGKKFWFMVCG